MPCQQMRQQKELKMNWKHSEVVSVHTPILLKVLQDMNMM